MKKLKEGTTLTIFQVISFLSACTLSVILFSWKIIPILILFGWSNNIAMIKQLASLTKKDKE